MSVWTDIHKRSNGSSFRKEDKPAVNPAAEQKKQEDTLRWYKEYSKKLRWHNIVLNILRIITIVTILACIVLSFLTGEINVLVLTLIPLNFLLLFNVYVYDDENDYF